MREITLNYLRTEITSLEEDIEYFKQKTIGELSSEEIESIPFMLGELYTLQRLIKYVRGLNERDFQLEIKKGTL